MFFSWDFNVNLRWILRSLVLYVYMFRLSMTVTVHDPAQRMPHMSSNQCNTSAEPRCTEELESSLTDVSPLPNLSKTALRLPPFCMEMTRQWSSSLIQMRKLFSLLCLHMVTYHMYMYMYTSRSAIIEAVVIYVWDCRRKQHCATTTTTTITTTTYKYLVDQMVDCFHPCSWDTYQMPLPSGQSLTAPEFTIKWPVGFWNRKWSWKRGMFNRVVLNLAVHSSAAVSW